MPTIDGITIADPIPLDEAVRCTTTFYADGGYSPNAPASSGRPPFSGFGRSVAKGQLVRITDSVVAAYPEMFETLPRQLTSEDVQRFVKEIERG
jgi:hypothetical protein